MNDGENDEGVFFFNNNDVEYNGDGVEAISAADFFTKIHADGSDYMAADEYVAKYNATELYRFFNEDGSFRDGYNAATLALVPAVDGDDEDDQVTEADLDGNNYIKTAVGGKYTYTYKANNSSCKY